IVSQASHNSQLHEPAGAPFPGPTTHLRFRIIGGSGQGPLSPCSWRASSGPSNRPECILFASFFVVRRYSGPAVIVAFTENVANSGQTQPLTNSSEQGATPCTSKLRNRVSGCGIPPGAPCSLACNV